MSENRTIFIGDVQWCYNELKLLIKKLKIQENDTVYFVWDIINKGPKSYKTLKYIYKNKKQFHCVMGNHEVNLLRYLNGEWYDDDSSDFEDLKEKFIKRPTLLEYIKNLPIYIEKENFILLHAWLIPGKKIENHTLDEITRTRDIDGKPWYEYYTWKKKIIYGHWAIDGIRIRQNTIGLDSGCVYGKMLSAYILETWEIIQQQALNLYINVYDDVTKTH